MNRKVLGMAVALVAVAMLAIPLVQAIPLKEKNNDKFQAFHGYGEFDFRNVRDAPHEWVPSFEEATKLVIDANPPMSVYTITVDGTTYIQGVDFDYVPISAKYMYIGITEWLSPAKLYPKSFHIGQLRVEWMFDFSKFTGGIEGTLRMLCNLASGYDTVNSLAGTGDLQNVQIKAVPTQGVKTPPFLCWARHDGTVIGWPDIQPAP